MSDLTQLTVPQLKNLLKTAGLQQTGNKADLVARLLVAQALSGASGGPPYKKAKTVGKVCVETCRPGKGSGCPIRGRGRPDGHVSCAEVDRMLQLLGVDAEKASLCTKAAIMKGYIVITGEKGDLEQVVVENKGDCGHILKATLADLLKQPDYGGLDYECGLEKATVICKVEGCDAVEDREGYIVGESRTYVTGLCEGRPSFDCGKFHNHCTDCPGFGQCIHDYREAHCPRCGKHYFAGNMGFECPNCRRKSAGFGGNEGRSLHPLAGLFGML